MESDMRNDEATVKGTMVTSSGQQQARSAASHCVMVLHGIDTSIGTLMEMNDDRFTRWVQGGNAAKLISIMGDDGTVTRDIDGCYAHDIIDGHMALNDAMPLPDAIIGTDGTWHDRPDGMDDDDWKCVMLTAILESDDDCRVSFVGIK